MMDEQYDVAGSSGHDDDARALLLAGSPATDRRIPVTGVPTAVLQGGSGPPLLLLHSAGEFAALWMRVLPDLVATHRVVAPDLPGHGGTGLPEQPWGPDQVLDWLDDLIVRTCPSPPTLVGHGLGGAIAARFAVERGDRLAGLVLVDALGLADFDPAPSFGAALHAFAADPAEHTRDDLFRQCFVDLDGLRSQLGERWTPLAAYALEGARAPQQGAALQVLMPSFGLSAVPPSDLARITVPTTLIWGRHDLQVRPGVAEAAGARYGWPVHVVDHAGDDPAMEQPEAFLKVLRAALAEPAGRAGDR
jgi:pimeloyl-ACP methyl ester carboxylesterase